MGLKSGRKKDDTPEAKPCLIPFLKPCRFPPHFTSRLPYQSQWIKFIPSMNTKHEVLHLWSCLFSFWILFHATLILSLGPLGPHDSHGILISIARNYWAENWYKDVYYASIKLASDLTRFSLIPVYIWYEYMTNKPQSKVDLSVPKINNGPPLPLPPNILLTNNFNCAIGLKNVGI